MESSVKAVVKPIRGRRESLMAVGIGWNAAAVSIQEAERML